MLPVPTGPSARSLPEPGLWRILGLWCILGLWRIWGFGVFWRFYVFPPVVWRGAGGQGGRWDGGSHRAPASPMEPGAARRTGTSLRDGVPGARGPSGGPAVAAAARGAVAAPPTHATSLPGGSLAALPLLPGPGWVKTQQPQIARQGLGAPEAGAASRCSPTSPSSAATPGSPCIQLLAASSPAPPGCWGGRRGGEIRGGILQCRIQVARRSH